MRTSSEERSRTLLVFDALHAIHICYKANSPAASAPHPDGALRVLGNNISFPRPTRTSIPTRTHVLMLLVSSHLCSANKQN